MKFAVFLSVLMIAVLLVIGVVVDAGKAVTQHQQIHSVAESAARAGTNAASGTSADGHAFTINPTMAIAAANNYLAAAGLEGVVIVSGDTVTVTITTEYDPILVVLPTIEVTSTGTAQLIGN